MLTSWSCLKEAFHGNSEEQTSESFRSVCLLWDRTWHIEQVPNMFLNIRHQGLPELCSLSCTTFLPVLPHPCRREIWPKEAPDLLYWSQLFFSSYWWWKWRIVDLCAFFPWGSIWQSFLNFILIIPEPQDGFSHIEMLNSCPILHPSSGHKCKQPAGCADVLFARGEVGNLHVSYLPGLLEQHCELPWEEFPCCPLDGYFIWSLTCLFEDSGEACPTSVPYKEVGSKIASTAWKRTWSVCNDLSKTEGSKYCTLWLFFSFSEDIQKEHNYSGFSRSAFVCSFSSFNKTFIFLPLSPIFTAFLTPFLIAFCVPC